MGAKTALIDRYGVFLGVKQGRFVLREGRDVKWDLSPAELESIIVASEGVSISASAIMLALSFGIDLVFMRRMRPVGRIIPYKYGTLMKNWALQIKLHESGGSLNIAKRMLEGKLHNQRMVLLEYSRRFRGSGRSSKHLDEKAEEILRRGAELSQAGSVEELLVIEGHAAKAYWSGVSHILPEDLGFRHRYTRSNPPPSELDSFNKALNIGYGILKKEVWRAIFLAGLNPYYGFLHKQRGGRPALVLDLMEEFRPISVDRPLIGLAKTNKGVILKLLSQDGEAHRFIWSHIIKYMKESHPPHTELINSQARKLVLHLQGIHRYEPYKSRW
ncbi:MAG: CRISPR-associated endonuclease Cas1 [Nitrososphaerota archaeon]